MSTTWAQQKAAREAKMARMTPEELAAFEEELRAKERKKTERKAERRRAGYSPAIKDGASQQLQDMRHVHRNAEEFDETVGQKNARALMKENMRSFHLMLASLEKAHALALSRAAVSAKSVATKAAEEVVTPAPEKEEEGCAEDVGTERCLAMAEKLLEESVGG